MLERWQLYHISASTPSTMSANCLYESGVSRYMRPGEGEQGLEPAEIEIENAVEGPLFPRSDESLETNGDNPGLRGTCSARKSMISGALSPPQRFRGWRNIPEILVGLAGFRAAF